MSRWVTVSGPPAASCCWNSGTTEPVEPSTLPKRTATNRQPCPLAGEDLVQPPAIAHIAQQRAAWHIGRQRRHLAVDLIEQEFRLIEKAEAHGGESGDLAYEFAADRTTGARHQHAPAGDEVAHGLGIEYLAWPAQQILDRHRQQCAKRRRIGISRLGMVVEIRQPGQAG